MKSNRARAWVVMGAAVVGLGACSNEVDTSENRGPWLSERDTSVAEVGEVSSDGCGCLAVGQWFRFDKLALTTIDGAEHPVIPTLNNLWQADIDAFELDIMMELTEVSDTTVVARVLNGARIDGTQDICALEDTAVMVTFPRSGCALALSNETPFNVYAGTETYPKNCTTQLPVKHAIPVSRARIEGTVSEDCSTIVQGKVPSGGLGQSELGKLCTCLLLPGDPAESCGLLEPGFAEEPCLGCNANYQSLSQLLTAFGDVTWSCQTESGAPSACITAEFTAKAIAGPPATCGE